MQINLEAFPESGNDNLKELVMKKVGRLEKFYDRIVSVDVYLKQSNRPDHEVVAELRMNVPNDTLFCEEHAQSYEAAIDEASRSMERQLKKFKDKMNPRRK